MQLLGGFGNDAPLDKPQTPLAVDIGAEHVEEVPPPDPEHDHTQFALAASVVGIEAPPVLQRLAVGALTEVAPLADPHVPLTTLPPVGPPDVVLAGAEQLIELPPETEQDHCH